MYQIDQQAEPFCSLFKTDQVFSSYPNSIILTMKNMQNQMRNNLRGQNHSGLFYNSVQDGKQCTGWTDTDPFKLLRFFKLICAAVWLFIVNFTFSHKQNSRLLHAHYSEAIIMHVSDLITSSLQETKHFYLSAWSYKQHDTYHFTLCNQLTSIKLSLGGERRWSYMPLQIILTTTDFSTSVVIEGNTLSS